MSHNDDRTPGGPQVGDRALQRALAAARAADQAGVPDPVADRERERARAEELGRAAKREFARRCTEQVKDVLGHDTNLKPGDWSVMFCAPGNPDSGSGIGKSLASATLNGVRLHASEYHEEPCVLSVYLDGYGELTPEAFGRALRRVQG